MRRIATTSLAIAMIGSTAAAQELTYGLLSYDYAELDVPIDVKVGFAQGGAEFSYGRLLVGADVAGLSSDLGDETFEDQSFGLSAAYRLTPQTLLGAGFFQNDGDGDDGTDVEVFGQYSVDNFALAVNITQDDNNDTFSSLYGQYTASGVVDLGLILTTSDIEGDDGITYYASADYNEGPASARIFYNDDTDGAPGFFGVRGAFEFGSQFRATGAYARLTDADTELNSIDIGAGINVADRVWIDGSIGSVEIGNDDFDTFGALLTFETGKRQRLDRAMSQRVIGDINQTSLGIFTRVAQ